MDTVTYRMDVVYFGSGAFGLPTLESLVRTHRVRAVVTQPDRPAGRGKKLTPNPIAAWAEANLPEAELLKPENVNEDAVRAHIREIPADAWVVIAFGQYLGPKLLADRFAVNLHASLLPRWRGAAPIHHAILAGDEITGNSVITLAEKMDAGFVLGQTTREIERAQTTGGLHDLLADDGPELVLDVLAKHAADELEYVEQNESLVTLAGKLGRNDARIDPETMTADECRRKINGLSPWPGVSAMLGDTRLKLIRSDTQEAGADAGGQFQPGELVDPAGGFIACAGGTVLRLLEVQPAGKKPMSWGTFVAGRDLTRGIKLEAVS